jgi:hypothetical protein
MRAKASSMTNSEMRNHFSGGTAVTEAVVDGDVQARWRKQPVKQVFHPVRYIATTYTFSR